MRKAKVSFTLVSFVATALLLHTQSPRFSDNADRGDALGTERSNRASRHSALDNRHAPLPVNLGLNHGSLRLRLNSF